MGKKDKTPSTVARKVPRPIVAPGPNPRGPPGWAEAQQERIADQNLAVSEGMPASSGLSAGPQDPAVLQEHHRDHVSMLNGHGGGIGSSSSSSNGPTSNLTPSLAGADAGSGHGAVTPGYAGSSSNPSQLPPNGASFSNGHNEQSSFLPSQQTPQHPLAMSTTAAEQQRAPDQSANSSMGTAAADVSKGSSNHPVGETSISSLTSVSSEQTGDRSVSSVNSMHSNSSNKSKSSTGRFRKTIHKMGEKLAFVPSKNSENIQNASTMPEVAP